MTDWLSEAEAACEAATEGPWHARPNPMRDDGVFIGAGELLPAEKGYLDRQFAERARRREKDIVDQQVPEADGQFIALSRTALPRALAIIRAADELAERLDKRFDIDRGESDKRILEALDAYRKARS